MTTKQTRKRSTRKTTRTSFGRDLIEVMQEVVAIERGTATPARVIEVPLTARKAPPSPTFGERLITGLTEAVTIERGDLVPVTITRCRCTAHTTTV